MFKYIEPVYKQNMILTADVLQEHTEYAHDIMKNIYMNYSDGIIAGVEITVTDACIKVGQGVVKHQNVLYSLDEAVSIPYEHTGELTFLRLRFADPVEQDGGIYYEAELVLTQEHTEFPYEMELGRFIASHGASLYKNTSSFTKLSLSYDNFDIRYVKYAAVEEATISPLITTLFAREMLDKNPTDVYDIAFLMQCMNKQPVAREVIKAYIQGKTHKKYTEITNEQIYRELEQILKQPVTQGRFQTRDNAMRRVIVD